MKRLEDLRKDRGVTKVAVQRMLGVSRPTYDKYELYPGEMRAKDLDLVCDFLHIKKSDIFFSN